MKDETKWSFKWGLLAGAAWPLLRLVAFMAPIPFGLRWIPGWPDFYMNIAAFIVTIPLIIWAQKKMWPHSNLTKLKKPQRLKKYQQIILGIAIAPLCIAAFALISFSTYPRTSEYFRSPNGRNTVVVIEQTRFPTRAAHPVRGRAFYDRSQRIILFSEVQTLEWIDEDTFAVYTDGFEWRRQQIYFN